MVSRIRTGREHLDLADGLFRAGKFAEAATVYSRVLADEPDDYHAVLRLGNVALLANRLEEAEELLGRAIRLSPGEPGPKSLLAEVFRRRDEFGRAAPLLREIGRTAAAELLESFAGIQPYVIEGDPRGARLSFEVTDPLPVVEVRVNGGEPVSFFIDTGACEVIIDAGFAGEVGATRLGWETGTFAGGLRAGVQHGRIDSLTLGDLTVRNIPVRVMGVRRFSDPVFGGRRVDGIIGTDLLSRFISTLDYPAGELVLRLKTAENLRDLDEEAAAGRHIVVPFWMAGDHYMVAWGTVNGSQPMLLFVDTGLAGGGFTCPESTLAEAGIRLDETAAGEGIGGGGKVKVVPFMVDSLTLGEARARRVRGLFPGSFGLEHAFGFRIGGLISHGFFRRFALTMDFTGMRFLLKPGPGAVGG